MCRLWKDLSAGSAAAEGVPQLLTALLRNGAEVTGRTRTEERYSGYCPCHCGVQSDHITQHMLRVIVGLKYLLTVFQAAWC